MTFLLEPCSTVDLNREAKAIKLDASAIYSSFLIVMSAVIAAGSLHSTGTIVALEVAQ